MAQVNTSYRMGGTMDTSHTVGTVAIRPQRLRSHGSAARATFRRLLAAVISGSDHPCWRTYDASAALAMLPPREQNRLLDSGLVATSSSEFAASCGLRTNLKAAEANSGAGFEPATSRL
jgi:hypothetical protein